AEGPQSPADVAGALTRTANGRQDDSSAARQGGVLAAHQ
ncbi:hypothetical protein TSOC_003771, partial [Tetrabaena socialis]